MATDDKNIWADSKKSRKGFYPFTNVAVCPSLLKKVGSVYVIPSFNIKRACLLVYATYLLKYERISVMEWSLAMECKWAIPELN